MVEPAPAVVEPATVVVVEDAPKEKKKAAPKKKQADAPVTAQVAVVEPAPAVVVMEDTPKEKKKAAPKNKKADASAVVEPAPAPAVVEVVLEKKKEEPLAVVEEMEELEEEEEGTAVKEWIYGSRQYLKSCETNCDADECDCAGVVYEVDTQEQCGTWDGKILTMKLAEEEEDD